MTDNEANTLTAPLTPGLYAKENRNCLPTNALAGEHCTPEAAVEWPGPAEPRSLSDEELLCAAQRGEASALEELLMRHRPMVYRAARRLSGNAQEAEDLTQETMLRAIKSIGSFRKEARFSSWLVAIVTNAAFALKRRERCIGWDSLDEPAHAEGLLRAWTLADSRRDPEQEFLHNEIRFLVRRAISKQHPNAQAILLTCGLDELPIKQAAHSLGISRAAAQTRLFRARHRLLRTLRRHAGTGVWH